MVWFVASRAVRLRDGQNLLSFDLHGPSRFQALVGQHAVNLASGYNEMPRKDRFHERCEMQSRVTNHEFRVPKNFAAGTLIALILFCLPTANVSAQEEPQKQAKPQERVSKPGEIQIGQKKVRVVNRAEMRPDRKPVSTPVNGKTVRMEEALKAPSRVVQGKRQADVDMAQAENPKVGSGEQRPRMEAEPKPAGSHLELVLKVTSGGAAEVVSAKELPGPAATSQTGPGQWVYAIFSGEKAIKAQAIPD